MYGVICTSFLCLFWRPLHTAKAAYIPSFAFWHALVLGRGFIGLVMRLMRG